MEEVCYCWRDKHQDQITKIESRDRSTQICPIDFFTKKTKNEKNLTHMQKLTQNGSRSKCMT